MSTVDRTAGERAARQTLDEPMYSVAETAIALNVSEPTIRRMIRSREIRAVRLGVGHGRTVRIPASALREASSRPVMQEDES
jgi:excisionase family DNA binding protein